MDALKLLPTTKDTVSLHLGYHSLTTKDCTSSSSTAFNPHFLLVSCRVGDAAKNAHHTNPENTVFDAKRLIGRRADDADVKKDQKHWPFKIISKSGKPSIQVQHKGETKDFTPEEISAMVLGKMKETAEAYLGHKVITLCLYRISVLLIPSYRSPTPSSLSLPTSTTPSVRLPRTLVLSLVLTSSVS